MSALSSSRSEPLDEGPAPALLLDEKPPGVEVGVHDAARIAWSATVPIPDRAHANYALTFELEVPTYLVGVLDPWAGLQSYARLDGVSDAREGDLSAEAFRRATVGVSSRLSRARDGFVRHCTLIRSSAVAEANHWPPLLLWVRAATTELANARLGILRAGAEREELALGDEFLSVRFWNVLTDCGRALHETRRTLEDRGEDAESSLDEVEVALAAALRDEIGYRRRAQFALAEPMNTLQLERLLSRMRWLKKHFERVLFLDLESYQVVSRLGGWFSAFAAILAYVWFLFWQLALERHPVAIGSGFVAFVLITAVAYASRERLKEVARSWLAGRAQKLFAQRIARFRLPPKDRGSLGTLVVSARESFSQSSAQRPDPVRPEGGVTHDVTVLRFTHRGVISRPGKTNGLLGQEIRLIYRLDLSPLFPRLHDAVRGFASLDERTGRIAILDVPRNYELPLRASLRWSGGAEETAWMLVLNKNGLLRVEGR